MTLQGTTVRMYQWGMDVDEHSEFNEIKGTKAVHKEIHHNVQIGQLSPETSISSNESIETVISNKYLEYGGGTRRGRI